VAVIGVGNVAMDVARILARASKLRQTDIADYALEALARAASRNLYHGASWSAQAAFTNPEVKEMGEMEEADVVVPAGEVVLDPLSQAYIESGQDKVAVRNVETLREYTTRPSQVSRRSYLTLSGLAR
jgi:ferredoxin--NADP+ reductase